MGKKIFQLITMLIFIVGCKKDENKEKIDCNIYGGGVVLSTQKHVDNFDCEFVENLYIQTVDTREKITITDKHFKKLKTIEGHLSISPLLGSIEMQENIFTSLEEVNWISITADTITFISGFNKLKHLPYITLTTPSLQKLKGFSDLVEMGTAFFETPLLNCNQLCFLYDKLAEGGSFDLIGDNKICNDTDELKNDCTGL